MAKNLTAYSLRGDTLAMAHPGDVGVGGPFAVTFDANGDETAVGDTLADALLAENAKIVEDVT